MDNNPLKHFITVDEYCGRYPWPSKSGMRWLIFNAKQKGIADCFIRVSRRVLIDEQAFLKWLENHRGVAAKSYKHHPRKTDAHNEQQQQ